MTLHSKTASTPAAESFKWNDRRLVGVWLVSRWRPEKDILQKKPAGFQFCNFDCFLEVEAGSGGRAGGFQSSNTGR